MGAWSQHPTCPGGQRVPPWEGLAEVKAPARHSAGCGARELGPAPPWGPAYQGATSHKLRFPGADSRPALGWPSLRGAHSPDLIWPEGINRTQEDGDKASGSQCTEARAGLTSGPSHHPGTAQCPSSSQGSQDLRAARGETKQEAPSDLPPRVQIGPGSAQGHTMNVTTAWPELRPHLTPRSGHPGLPQVSLGLRQPEGGGRDSDAPQQ